MPDQPNFLFFITDQHRADWLGCAGHTVVRTPNIDAIAARGTRFADFNVAMPVCMPNRASLMTGRMPSTHGLRMNGAHLPPTARTFGDVLQAAGYDTALIGKAHLQPFTGRPPARPPDTTERLIDEAHAPDPADYGHEEADRYEGDEPYRFPPSYYGFRHVEVVTGHGDACGGHYLQWFRKAAPDWQALRDPANGLPHNYSCPQAHRTPIPEHLYPTAWIGDRAVDYLSDPARGDAPFFAFVSFPDPHHPFNPPGRYWDMYDPEDFDLPLPPGSHRNPPPPLRWLEEKVAQGWVPSSPQTATMASARHLKEMMALTAGMITMIDDQVGRVIAALKASGQYDNTVIVFTSDHGDYLGDFGLYLKGAMPLDSINRVPFIWSDPADRSPRTTGTLASTIDIAASILDRAGLNPYWGMQGRSFLPALDGVTPHRDEVLIEHNDSGPRHSFETPARVRTLKTKDWRFSIYGGEDWGELYDRNADPKETHNLWDDPAHAATRGHLAERLAHHLTAQMDESPRTTTLA